MCDGASMNQQQFEAVIRNKIETIGDGEKQRRYIYAALREKMLALAAKSPGETERWRNVQAAFDAAVDAVESAYTAPAAPSYDAGPSPSDREPSAPIAPVTTENPSTGAPFRSPDDAPKTAAEYFWIKVAAGCAAFGGVLDFLKPIVDLQSPSVVVAAVAAVALTVAARLIPGRAAMFGHVRNVSLAVAAAVIGLFGLQSQFPGNAPNGAIAEVLPGLVQLQAAIDGLRAPIEKIGQDTGRIAEATDQMKKQLEEMAESSDRAVVAREIVQRGEYQLDAESLYLAITTEHDNAELYFEEAGFSPSETEVDAMLTKAPVDGGKFNSVLAFYLNYGPVKYRRRVASDLEEFISIAKKTRSIDSIYETVCGKSGDNIPAWISARLLRDCLELESFYRSTFEFIERGDEYYLSFDDGKPYFMPASAPAFQLEELSERIQKKAPVIGYVDGLVNFDNYSFLVSAAPYRQWVGMSIGSSRKSALIEACQVVAERGMCTARIYFMIDSSGSATFLGATNHAAAAFPSPKAYAAAAAETAVWGVASEMRDIGIRVFAGAYDRGSKLSVLLYCELTGANGATPGLSFRPNTEESAIDAHVREPYTRKDVGLGSFFVAFNGGDNGYSGDFERRSEGIVDVYLTNRTMLEDMKNGRSIQLYVDDRPNGQVSLAGFTAAYTKLRELTQCGW